MTHDPMCPRAVSPRPVGSNCFCHLIRRTRADQDQKSRADERERITRFVENLQQKQWGIMSRSRDKVDTLGRQDYMIASAEAYAAQKILDFLADSDE